MILTLESLSLFSRIDICKVFLVDKKYKNINSNI